MTTVTREELDAVRNHIRNIPTIGAMYAPVLVEWCAVLLRERDEARAEVERLRAAARGALEALTNCNSHYGHRCVRCDSELDEGDLVGALRKALEGGR